MESNANLAEKSSQELENTTEDPLWEQQDNSEQSSELEEFVLRIHGISELKDYPSDTWTSTPDTLPGERNSDTGFFDSSFASFYYSQNLSIGKLEMGNQTFSPRGGPSSSAESLTTASSSGSPSSMSTLTSDSPLSSLDSTTSDESKKKDEILSGINWNYGQHIGASKRLRIRLRQVQEGLIRAKQYNIVKERLDLLLSVMSARKALGNPLSPQEIPTDLYNIIFHPQNI